MTIMSRYKYPECLKNVGNNSLCCDLCNSWIYKCCSGLSKKDIEEFDTDIEWMCPNCSTHTFPFLDLNNQESSENLLTSSEHDFLHKLESFEYSEKKFLYKQKRY